MSMIGLEKTLDPVAGEFPTRGPKAGAFGVFCVFVFGVVAIVAVFSAAYMWADGDSRLGAAIGVASIIIPTTAGYFVAELRHQRAGAWSFVLVAAMLAGAAASWAYGERDAFNDRMDLVVSESELSNSAG